MMASQATFLWLEVNWQKTKVQPLGSREDEPSTITVQRQKVAVVEEFFYLVSPLSTQQLKSSHDISCHSAITHAAMQNLDYCIW